MTHPKKAHSKKAHEEKEHHEGHHEPSKMAHKAKIASAHHKAKAHKGK